MSIEEGDLAVTPDGKTFEIDCEVLGEKIHKPGIGTYRWTELVKANAPIRVKVDAEWQAEALVSLAEENNFHPVKGKTMSLLTDKVLNSESTDYCFYLNLSFYLNLNRKYIDTAHTNRDLEEGDPDLTFTDDLPQIESWIKYHGESEDEKCERCKGSGTVTKSSSFRGSMISKETELKPCPDCTDDDSYSEPRPEDGDIFDELFDFCNEAQAQVLDYDLIDEEERESFSIWTRNIIPRIHDLKQELSELQEELDEVWEELDMTERTSNYYITKAGEYKVKNEELRKRIDWMIDYLSCEEATSSFTDLHSMAKKVLKGEEEPDFDVFP